MPFCESIKYSGYTKLHVIIRAAVIESWNYIIGEAFMNIRVTKRQKAKLSNMGNDGATLYLI
jgi:hypothetical protein